MSHGKDHPVASGLLNDLDDIRSLLADSVPDDAIPVLEDAVDSSESPIPLLYDEIEQAEADLQASAAARDEALRALQDELRGDADDPRFGNEPPDEDEDASGMAEQAIPFLPSMSIADLLAGQALEAAIRNRIDATLEQWVSETLQQELALLRSRLLEAVRTEVHAFIAAQHDRSTATGRPHGE